VKQPLRLRKRLQDITEEEIVSALKNRNRDAMGIVYDKYSSFLFGLIFKIVHSEEIAEDILQEVYVKIWKNIDSFDSKKAKFITWIANITRNLSIDKIRSKEYKNQLQNHDIEDYVNIIEDSSASGFNPEHIGVREMLEKLQPEQKALIDLVYFQGYTQADAAEKLGIPLGTVKTRIRSAINNLREIFT
jgi:RNA polymerase sigma factor (sigma-70 family)